MFGSLPLLYIFFTCLTRVYGIIGAPQFDTFETAAIGNPTAAIVRVQNVSTTSTVHILQVYWDTDKIRGTHVHKISCPFLSKTVFLHFM